MQISISPSHCLDNQTVASDRMLCNGFVSVGKFNLFFTTLGSRLIDDKEMWTEVMVSQKNEMSQCVSESVKDLKGKRF